jgi:LCP family protein required for cell wall assembly
MKMMIENMQLVLRRRGGGEETVPMRRQRQADTQPVRRIARAQRSAGRSAPPPPPPDVQPPGRRSACLSPFALALLVLVFVCGGVAVMGHAARARGSGLARTNILILGLDRRPEQGFVVRSDTIVLATIYPASPRVALLSIPRDLYVDIPGHGPGRINTAHFWGENDVGGGGPALAKQAILENFGVPVDHYVRLDFNGFRVIVDAVGGIEIDVEEPVVDNAYPTDDYGTIRIEIPPGRQHMDGETALRYARSRHGSSDFERAQRQQQILVALAQRMLVPEAWPRWPTVYAVVMTNVDTDLGFLDLILMAPTLLQVGPKGIERRVIDREMTQPWTTPTGGAVLLPRWEVIMPVVEELFLP